VTLKAQYLRESRYRLSGKHGMDRARALAGLGPRKVIPDRVKVKLLLRFQALFHRENSGTVRIFLPSIHEMKMPLSDVNGSLDETLPYLYSFIKNANNSFFLKKKPSVNHWHDGYRD
jgi:hypothetical protein